MPLDYTLVKVVQLKITMFDSVKLTVTRFLNVTMIYTAKVANIKFRQLLDC